MGLGKWLAEAVGGSIAETADGIAGAIDRFVETPEEKAAAEMLRAKMRQEPHKWQAEINKVEAGHRTTFVAGWRPAIGWTCAVSLGAYYIPKYVMAAVLWSIQCWQANELLAYPVSADGILELTLAMLGMGGIRMLEKMKRVAK